MDIAQNTEAPFAETFPLPFRVVLLGGMGLLCWATNLHGLHRLGVDVAGILELRARDNDLSAPRLTAVPQDAYVRCQAVYRLFYAYATWSFCGWALFRFCTHATGLGLVDAYKFIPAVIGLSIVMALASPFDHIEKYERDRFIFAIRRCLFSPVSMPIYFSDVILADIFTSFAKVIGDVWLSLCMLLPNGSLLIFPDQDGWSRLMVPCLMSIPYLVRFRQCVVEYMQPTNTSRKPLYNALKYTSSFPVIFLSAAQRLVVSELVAEKGAEIEEEAWHGEHPLFRLWLLSVAVNSLYSFWWDVTNDWGLDLLRPQSKATRIQPPRPLLLPRLHSNTSSLDNSSAHTRHSLHQNGNGLVGQLSQMHSRRGYPWGLRPTLLFPLPSYPLAIFVNLILRLTWSLKLSSHLHIHASGAVVIFWIEMAELLRRWIWVFFRVEWECVKKINEMGEYAPEMEDLEMEGVEFDVDAKVRTIPVP